MIISYTVAQPAVQVARARLVNTRVSIESQP
jgi:hypothetical protein